MHPANGTRLSMLTLGVASAYYFAGSFGLLFAVPGGYATLFWPSSGIALAGVCLFGPWTLPGVWLGSYLVNIWVPNSPDNAVLFTSGLIPASGAVLQALAGWRGMLQAKRWPAAVLVVALSALINGTIGPFGLWFAGLLPTEHVRLSWLIWWTGDVLGMLVALPLILRGQTHA